MRILHIIATLDLKAGGPSNSIRSIVAAYAAAGSEGEVLSLDDPSAAFLQQTGFKVHALGPVSWRFGFTLRLVPWLQANRDRFDGVVVHGLWQYIGWAVHCAIHPHKPYLVFTHGMLDPHFKSAYPHKHLKKALYWLASESRVLCDAAGVLFTSKAEALDARKTFSHCVWNECIVPYGARAPHGDPSDFQKAFLAAFPALRTGDGTARPYVLFMGRMDAKKGCDMLVEAFACVAQRAPDLHLVFAGPDTSRAGNNSAPGLSNECLTDRLTEQASALGIGGRVHWTGMLYGEQKWGAFYGCEVFALPSHQENFGIAVAEAMACGKPVLISDKVNICHEIVRDGAAFVAADTVDGTTRTLEQWIALTPAQKINMEANALDCFRRRYDMKANASDIVEIILDKFSTPVEADIERTNRSSQDSTAGFSRRFHRRSG